MNMGNDAWLTNASISPCMLTWIPDGMHTLKKEIYGKGTENTKFISGLMWSASTITVLLLLTMGTVTWVRTGLQGNRNNIIDIVYPAMYTQEFLCIGRTNVLEKKKMPDNYLKINKIVIIVIIIECIPHISTDWEPMKDLLVSIRRIIRCA